MSVIVNCAKITRYTDYFRIIVSSIDCELIYKLIYHQRKFDIFLNLNINNEKEFLFNTHILIKYKTII